jgi:hypothetical protein
MTEPSTTETREAQSKVFIPKDVLFALVNELATQLQEPNRPLLRKIVVVVGVDRAQALLDQTLAIEAAGGQLTRDGTRRKTAGGVFISLARAQAVDTAERRRLLDFGPPKKRPVQPPATPPPPDGAPAAPPPDAPTAQARQPTPAPPPPVPVPPSPAPTWA